MARLRTVPLPGHPYLNTELSCIVFLRRGWLVTGHAFAREVPADPRFTARSEPRRLPTPSDAPQGGLHRRGCSSPWPRPGTPATAAC
ncbi:hypothetical protein GCM10027203_25070 [Nonomuraea fastidiosa]